MLVHRCSVCNNCFHYAAQLKQHDEVEYEGRMKHCRLATLRKGYVCKACGDKSQYYADGRALKRHYCDRSAHSAEDLIAAGVKLWAGISTDPDDMEVVRQVYEDCGIIEVAEPRGDEDSEYEAA